MAKSFRLARRIAVAISGATSFCNRWRKQAEAKPVSRAAFIRALRLASISVQDRASSLIFECGDLFEDHGLEVCLDAKGHVGTIDLA